MKNLPRPILRALTLATLILGLFAVYIALILLNNEFSSNIVFAQTMLDDLSEWAYLLIELLAIVTSYTFFLFSLFSDGPRGGVGMLISYVAVTALRHAVLLWLGFGELWSEFANLALELLQFGLIVLVCYLSVRSFDRTYTVMKQGSTALGRFCPARAELVYPRKKQPIKSDPIKRGTLASAVILSGFRVIGRLIYDFHYGMPTDLVEALWMLLCYSVDVLIGIGGYFLMLWIVRRLSR